MVEVNGENYQSFKNQIDHIDFLLDLLHKNTQFRSSLNYTTHPEWIELVEMGDRIVPYLFHCMTHTGWNWIHIILLRELVPNAPKNIDHAGLFYHQIHDWMGWYLSSSYYEKDDIYHGLVDA